MSLYDRDWYREAYKEKEQKYGKDFRYKPKNRITTHLPKQAWRYIIGIPLILLSLGGFFYTKSPNLQTIQHNQTINDSAIGFGYKLTHLYFCASQNSNVENTIKDFLATENIDYTKLTYDSEQQTYFVALSGYLPTTKTNVITQGELLEEKFQNYCLKQNSNFGITNLGVLYRYNTLQ